MCRLFVADQLERQKDIMLFKLCSGRDPGSDRPALAEGALDRASTVLNDPRALAYKIGADGTVQEVALTRWGHTELIGRTGARVNDLGANVRQGLPADLPPELGRDNAADDYNYALAM